MEVLGFETESVAAPRQPNFDVLEMYASGKIPDRDINPGIPMNFEGADRIDTNKLFTNEVGDQYKLNSIGQVRDFTYLNADGSVAQSISEVRRDMDGLVYSFKDKDGIKWAKQHRDPHEGYWFADNHVTAKGFAIPIDLGEVRLFRDGLRISGSDRGLVYLPQR